LMPAVSNADVIPASLAITSYHEARFIPRIVLLTATPVFDGFTVTTAFAVTGTVMVKGMVMVLVTVPTVTETVMVYVPAVAELLAVSVIT